MNCRIGKVEWVFVFVVAIIVDIVQAILTALGVGVIVNRIISAIMAFVLNIYFYLRGVSMSDSKILFAIITGIIGELIPVIDVLPLWTREVFVVWSSVKAERLAAKVPIAGKVLTKAVNTARATKQPPDLKNVTRILGQSKQIPDGFQ